MDSSGKLAFAFAAACVIVGAIGLTGYYLTWWADSAAAVVGHPVALFVVPPIIWFTLGTSFAHTFLSPKGFHIRPWQFGVAAGAASLVWPLITMWAMSQPH